METTRTIAERAAALAYDDLPGEARELARQCVLDYLACATAGADDPLVGMLLDEAGIAAPLGAPAGVEVTRREGDDGRAYTFALNHNTEEARVPLPSPLKDLLTGDAHEGSLTLAPRGVAILVPA